jgi:hypothetical protein
LILNHWRRTFHELVSRGLLLWVFESGVRLKVDVIVTRNKTLLFLPLAPERIRISGWLNNFDF